MPLFIGGDDDTLEKLRSDLDRAGKLPRPRSYRYSEVMVGGVPGIRSTPKTSTTNRHILYIHGGGYFIGSSTSHTTMATRLAAKAEAIVTTIDYRLAPEHRFPAALDDCVSAAKALMSEFGASNLAIAGDSAGGGATVATLCALRDAGDELPACAFVISPWTDLTASGETMVTKAEIDPVITMSLLQKATNHYLADTPADNPGASPVFADLAGLPPVLIHVGENEMLLNDSTRLGESAKGSAVDVEIKIWPEMWHVFQAFVGLMREANASMQEGADFISGHTANA